MKKEKRSFSKTLLIQESILVWISTIAFIILAFICVFKQSYTDLGWVTVLAGFPWTAYGVSQAFYYKKSEKENTEGGVVYAKAIQNVNPSTESPEG